MLRTSSYPYLDRFIFLLRNLYYYRHATLPIASFRIYHCSQCHGRFRIFSVLLNSPGDSPWNVCHTSIMRFRKIPLDVTENCCAAPFLPGAELHYERAAATKDAYNPYDGRPRSMTVFIARKHETRKREGNRWMRRLWPSSSDEADFQIKLSLIDVQSYPVSVVPPLGKSKN